MHRVSVSKKSHGLNKVSCLCGLAQFFTRGIDADYLASTHGLKNQAEIVTFNDGVRQLTTTKRAKPGRNAGGIGHLDGEGGGWDL